MSDIPTPAQALEDVLTEQRNQIDKLRAALAETKRLEEANWDAMVRARDERDQLRELLKEASVMNQPDYAGFAAALLKDWFWEVGDYDAIDMQDLAYEYGLLTKHTFPSTCEDGENCACDEYYGPDVERECFRFHPHLAKLRKEGEL